MKDYGRIVLTTDFTRSRFQDVYKSIVLLCRSSENVCRNKTIKLVLFYKLVLLNFPSLVERPLSHDRNIEGSERRLESLDLDYMNFFDQLYS